MSALDAAALLVPEAQTKQLTSFVSHLLETDQDILPSVMATELATLTDADFSWLISRQLALVLECSDAVEEMSDQWFRHLDHSPFEDC